MTPESISVGVASAWEALNAHRLRSALTLLGVSVGVVSVLAVAAYGQYASAQVDRILAQFGSNLVAVTPGVPQQTRGARIGRLNTLTTDDVIALQQQVPYLLALSGVKSGSVNVVAGRYNWSTQVAGVSAGFPTIQALRLASGTFLSDADEQSTAPVAVLGARAAVQLFPGGDPIRQRLRVSGADFQVIGVLAERGQSADGNLDDIIYIPLSTALRRLYGGAKVDRIEVRVDDAAHIGPAMAAITTVLEQRHHIAIGKADDFQVQNFQRVADRARQTDEVLSAGLTAAAGLALAIAGFGIMNIMLLSVTERTPEIGLRLAVGARSGDVRAQFLAEALTLCLGGVGIGAVVGLIGATVASQQVGVALVPPLDTVLMAAAITGSIGLIFGSYPAERAARLDPVIALRNE